MKLAGRERENDGDLRASSGALRISHCSYQAGYTEERGVKRTSASPQRLGTEEEKQ